MALDHHLRLARDGESFWYLSSGIDKVLFAETLALFAREAGAGWHIAPGLAVPEGLRLVYLPPYTPELQPAETLWVRVDEPIANRYFDTLAELDATVGARVKGQAGFHS